MLLEFKILFFEKLSSTNTHALTLLRSEDIPEGTVIQAAYQSAGRGQAGNKWESERDKNLLFSIILKPENIEPPLQFLISMTASLAITDFLDNYTGESRIKWPNDIYIKSDKIAGMLIENAIIGNSIAYSVAGIGININQKKFVSGAVNPVSLANLTGNVYDTDTCMNEFLSCFARRYDQLTEGPAAAIREAYLSKLYRMNEWHSFTDKDSPFTGRIRDVDISGRLVVEDEKMNLRAYDFKEVEFR